MATALGVFLLPIFISVALMTSTLAASVEEFYRGKTIQFIVGGSAGGGYDTYTRLIARHFPQVRSRQTVHCRSKHAWSGYADCGELHL